LEEFKRTTDLRRRRRRRRLRVYDGKKRTERVRQRDDMYQDMKIFIILFPFVGKRMTRESDDDEKTMKR
tara:strand:- start:1138 stop:1344 length:207 start_codon:yes stop_codon:yes gene_type:complete